VSGICFGWMRCGRAPGSVASKLPLVISDHADWDGLTATISATGAGEIWVTMPERAGALVPPKVSRRDRSLWWTMR